MRNRKTRTVNRAYANQTGANFGNVWDGLIRMGLHASTLWQDFWGLSVIVQKPKAVSRRSRHTWAQQADRNGSVSTSEPWSTEALLGGMRKLYDDDSLEWKSAEQAQALTLVMSWTEQVVIVLPTGAGKTPVFMLPCTLPDAGITILIVPLVSLCCDLLRRLKELGIDHLEWLPGERRVAALVLVSIEAASTKDFLTYARTLIDQQKLDRIVFEECHLTVTAARYRDRIVDVTAIRELRTQFVYLTATLPPSVFSEFEERNHLLHPKVIRASSNRPNIFYEVRRARSGEGSLLQQAAAIARAMYSPRTTFVTTQDKIILYVRTRDEAHELAGLLGCPAYTAKIGTADVKKQVVADWIQSTSQPCIVATAAFAEGFDYPHVRVVINVNEPDSLILFAQESGRGGRDGRRAHSIVLLPAKWQATDIVDAETEGMQRSTIRDAGLGKQREKQAVHRYLQGEQCFRISLTEYLDPACYRRWCMVGDVPCAMCKECHPEPVPVRSSQTKALVEDRFTGAACIRRARREEYSELARFRGDLIAVRGSCLLCRGLGQIWDHTFSSCSRRHEVFKDRDRARRRHEQRGRRWIAPYTACFWCLNPQSVCSRADPELGRETQQCEDKDVVLPLCYGIFHSLGGPRWLEERFGRRFNDIDAFFDWLGQESRLGGVKAIQAARVAAERLREFWVF